jgi:hypothetical protein
MERIPGNDRYLDPPDDPTRAACDKCGSRYSNDDMVEVRGEWLCRECENAAVYPGCDICGIICDGDLDRNVSGLWYCEACVKLFFPDYVDKVKYEAVRK